MAEANRRMWWKRYYFMWQRI